MEFTKLNTALDLSLLSSSQIVELCKLGSNTVNRVGHLGMPSMNERNEWNILIYYEGEYKRVFPQFDALVDFQLLEFDEFVSIHFKNNLQS